MGKRIDKVIAVGASAAAAVGIWDRVTGWWRRRREAKADAQRLTQYHDERRAQHELNLLSDEANIPLQRKCPHPGCQRPEFHSICQCGVPPCPRHHGPRLKPWGER